MTVEQISGSFQARVKGNIHSQIVQLGERVKSKTNYHLMEVVRCWGKNGATTRDLHSLRGSGKLQCQTNSCSELDSERASLPVRGREG